MVERRVFAAPSTLKRRAGGDYFPEVRKPIVCIPTGCAGLDCVLGGGWALGRTSNVVGDKAVGKTLLAIEACANFAAKFPKGKIWYRESEAAFDEDHARNMGLPLKRVDFGPEGIGTAWDTIEDIFEDLDEKIAEAAKSKAPGLYIIDSLDALTSRAALDRKIGQGSFNLEKQKILGELFATLIRRVKKTNIHLMIVSQIRDAIGFVVGEKHRRSGGKSLDFYASQIIWLSHLKQITDTKKGVKRVVGVRVGAVCKKNKVSVPFRRFEFIIRFGYGVDDLESSLGWLEEHKKLKNAGITASGLDEYLEETNALDDDLYRERAIELAAVVKSSWDEVEADFTPTRRKYA
jgi:RecA/RadA recombinase